MSSPFFRGAGTLSFGTFSFGTLFFDTLYSSHFSLAHLPWVRFFFGILFLGTFLRYTFLRHAFLGCTTSSTILLKNIQIIFHGDISQKAELKNYCTAYTLYLVLRVWHWQLRKIRNTALYLPRWFMHYNQFKHLGWTVTTGSTFVTFMMRWHSAFLHMPENSESPWRKAPRSQLVLIVLEMWYHLDKSEGRLMKNWLCTAWWLKTVSNVVAAEAKYILKMLKYCNFFQNN